MDDNDVFVTRLDIGSFIVLVTLINELVLFPIFEALKNRLTNAIAIHKVSNSAKVVLRSDTWLSKLLGVADNVKPDSFSFGLAYFIKVLFRGLAIAMLVYWESSAEQVTFAQLSNQQLAQGRQQLTGIRIMSPMPFSGLSENEIIRMVTFSPNGVEQNGSYVVLDGEDYFFKGDDACTSVTDGRLTVYLSRAEINGRDVNRICLDGKEKRPTRVATELNVHSRSQRTYSLSALTLESTVATDVVSTIYKVNTSHNGDEKDGYAALTKFSHQNGNTIWSFYGVIHGKRGNKLEYLNIPIHNSLGRPCGEEQIGTWNFSKGMATCPDGTEVESPTGAGSSHVVDANWTIPSSKLFQRDLSKLALQWVAETPFSDYVAKSKFAEEVWSRMNRQVYFVSDFSDSIELPLAEKVQHTQTSRKRVIITTAVLITILVILVIFLIVEQMEMRRHNIHIDFCDVGSVLWMWSSEVVGKPTSIVSIGLTQRGCTGQHLGTMNTASESISELESKMTKRDKIQPLQ